jgi:hypothetical protein
LASGRATAAPAGAGQGYIISPYNKSNFDSTPASLTLTVQGYVTSSTATVSLLMLSQTQPSSGPGEFDFFPLLDSSWWYEVQPATMQMTGPVPNFAGQLFGWTATIDAASLPYPQVWADFWAPQIPALPLAKTAAIEGAVGRLELVAYQNGNTTGPMATWVQIQYYCTRILTL